MGLDLDDVPPGDRASIDGQVAGDLRFDAWLTKKGAATQDDILGPVRAQMFREGKLKLPDLIRDDGTVLSLAQLRKRLSLN